MHIANKINPILVMFLLISFTTIYGSDFNLSYGQISLVPDNSLIAQTTDCITSMMTSALIGVNSDCTDNISKINSTYPDSTTTPASSSSNHNPDSTTTPASSSSNHNPDSTTTPASSSSNHNPDSTTTPASSSSNHNPYNLSKNNPFYHEFQTKNNTTSDDSISIFTSESSNPIDSNYASAFTSPPQDNPSTFLKSPPQDNPSTFLKSPPQDNPSTFSGLQQQSINQPVSNPYSFQSLHTTINKYPNIAPNPTSTQSDIGSSLEGKNKHSKEISECFDRAFSIDNYLSDSEIIECAKDRDSFSQNSLNNYALSDKMENNDNKDNDGKTDNKHSKEISECFDRAFSIDNYLSDSEIIECAKDRDSFK
ncbi:hypothetical protein [Candidatus Nitrosocosmicus hydrocola]|uniref:hypothetical protein n=1 Tax=Candidatus Nitrosocosmicus hydrocola TaxID=1826872 RepID=UPI000B256432|nr:hypothetical protein [Candidatus Nitrosocosmicus hydrocola]